MRTVRVVGKCDVSLSRYRAMFSLKLVWKPPGSGRSEPVPLLAGAAGAGVSRCVDGSPHLAVLPL